MIKKLLFFILLSTCFGLNYAYAFVRGIYINQGTIANTSKMNYLINKSKETGINTFVVDMLYNPNSAYKENIKLLQQNGIEYVVRIVIFPEGGTAAQVANDAFWQAKYKYVEQAIAMGAKRIQLDYIRFNTKQPASNKNAQRIHEVIQWYRNKIPSGVGLETDIFGEASFKPSRNIGQDAAVFAQTVSYVCPMVYPSHYRPYDVHSRHPYTTIYDSLISLKSLIAGTNAEIIAWIEAKNHRYHSPDRVDYIRQEIKAVEDAGASGFYVWSPNNQYDNLFRALK